MCLKSDLGLNPKKNVDYFDGKDIDNRGDFDFWRDGNIIIIDKAFLGNIKAVRKENRRLKEQLSNRDEQLSNLNKQVSNLNKQVSNLNKQVSNRDEIIIEVSQNDKFKQRQGKGRPKVLTNNHKQYIREFKHLKTCELYRKLKNDCFYFGSESTVRKYHTKIKKELI